MARGINISLPGGAWKRLNLIISVLIIVSSILFPNVIQAQLIPVTEDIESRGWGLPLRDNSGNKTLYTYATATYNSPTYSDTTKEHGGLDFFRVGNTDLENGTEVYAVGPGYVVQTRTAGEKSVVVIRHTFLYVDNSKQPIYGIYGHVIPSVVQGQAVNQGDLLGNIYQPYPHLHFGINVSDDWAQGHGDIMITDGDRYTNEVYPNVFMPGWLWGYVPADQNPDHYGFRDPFFWLSQHTASVEDATPPDEGGGDGSGGGGCFLAKIP